MMDKWKESRKIDEPISMLMPVSNEIERIESVIAENVEVIFRHLPKGSEFLIEEAGSTDGTKELLLDLQKRWPFLDITFKEEKEGFAKATKDLYRRAKCPWVFFTDSDGQCVSSEFWKLIKFMDDFDFITGRKRPRYDPFSRRVTSYFFNLFAKILFKFNLKDINFGFRLCKRSSVLKCLDSTKYMPTTINAEILIIAHMLKYKIKEVDIYHRPRLSGLSRGLVSGSLLKESLLALKALIKLYKKMDEIKSHKI
jgi:dolichol-phosphate mannosyltransferase